MKVIFVLSVLLIFGIMEDLLLYSLEEDECNELFITRTSSADGYNKDKIEMHNAEDSHKSFLGVAHMDFQSPCSSLVGEKQMYSDISDAEDDIFQSSQQCSKR